MKKPVARGKRIDQYLYRNSYFYKWGKKVWKSRPGKTLVLLLMAGFLLIQGIYFFQKLQVRHFIQAWQRCENRGDWPGFASGLDLDPGNRDFDFFPDWKGEFFDGSLQLDLRNLRIDRLRRGVFRVAAEVRFLDAGEVTHRFFGYLFVHRRQGLKIYRVES